MKDDIFIEQEGIKIQLRKLEYRWDDRRDRNQFLKRQTNVHVHIKGEHLLDQLVNRRQRPYTTWKKELMPLVARLIEENTGLVMQGGFAWSQKLGCSCPCSPGFKTTMKYNGAPAEAYTVWVTI